MQCVYNRPILINVILSYKQDRVIDTNQIVGHAFQKELKTNSHWPVLFKKN